MKPAEIGMIQAVNAVMYLFREQIGNQEERKQSFNLQENNNL